jgi:uncharacterized damage-inducible protein DinB
MTFMRDIVTSIEEEYLRYKKIGESALAQVPDGDLSKEPPGNGNSLAALVWHVAGNFESRFTDFRTTDGEKPTRDRDSEFVSRHVTRAEILDKWQRGWAPLLSALQALTDADLAGTVVIRTQPLRIDQALHRSLAHVAYHVGQMVYLAKLWVGDRWDSLSIPIGQSAAFNAKLAASKAAYSATSYLEEKVDGSARRP